MGGRGSASSPIKWDWQGEYDFGNDRKMINKDPIGKENTRLYKDTVNNLTSIFPIIDVKDISPVSINGATGVAVISVDVTPLKSNSNLVELKGDIKLGFDPSVFATHYSLIEAIDSNFNSSYISTANDNHIVVHELAHVLDYQLSIKKNANMTLREFLEPQIVPASDAMARKNEMLSYVDKNKRFSAGFADALQKELKLTPTETLNQLSNYAQTNEAEFFAESFAKWYLSKNKSGTFEKAFEKVLNDKMKKI